MDRQVGRAIFVTHVTLRIDISDLIIQKTYDKISQNLTGGDVISSKYST